MKSGGRIQIPVKVVVFNFNKTLKQTGIINYDKINQDRRTRILPDCVMSTVIAVHFWKIDSERYEKTRIK